MPKPLIGITLDAEEGGGYAPLPWYALRDNYASAVHLCGGIPVMLPHHPDLVGDYLEKLDGIIFTGGEFDIDPTAYGAESIHETITLKHKRTTFERQLMQMALDRKMPLLGICAGEQLLNVLLGGTLIQHIPDEIKDPLPHEQENPRTEPSHSVTITKNTLLHTLTDTLEMQVNSSHHQAVKDIGNNVIINAIAPDGVIEGIEWPDHPFCLGVEWHPEYLIDPGDRAILVGLVRAAAGFDLKC